MSRQNEISENETGAVNSAGEDLVLIGKISGVFGVKGWLKVSPYTSNQKDILSYKQWYLYRHNEWQAIDRLDGRVHGKAVIVQLPQIVDRDQAALLNGVEIAIRRSELPKLGVDEYYWNDLIGLQVQTLAGQELGLVTHLVETGANDVLVVLEQDQEQDQAGEAKELSNSSSKESKEIKERKERLIPYILHQVVKSVDLSKKLIVVDWDPEF